MTTLVDLNGTRWTGTSELWLDPLGNDAVMSACTVEVDGSTVRYRWSYEGKECDGLLALGPATSFVDTFHSPKPMACRVLPSARGLVQVEGGYGEQLEWGWRIGLFHRSASDQLVLLMTNIAPSGEETRAVRMIVARA